LLKINDKYFDDYITRPDIDKMVASLAAQIKKEYPDSQNMLAVCVLNGAMPFFTDLIFHLPPDIGIDCLRISSYGDSTESSGRIKMVLDVQADVAGKDVLIVEDIVDTGLSQSFLLAHFAAKGAKSVKVCALFNKSVNNKTNRQPDYFGLEIPDYFIVGYGLDYAQKARNLDKVVKLHEE